MLSLRACATAFRSGICGLGSSVFPNYGAGSSAAAIATSKCFSTTITNNLYRTIPPSFLSSSLPALAFQPINAALSGRNGLFFNPSRSIMKIFWPRPREVKRIRNHGWKTRMSSPSGRRIIMRRILRGRHVLSH